jgi:hypothetical protein
MAHEGHIIIRKSASERAENAGGQERSIRRFFIPELDKGSRKPAFCNRQMMERFREETESMRRTLDSGMVEPTMRTEYELELKKREKRQELLNQSAANAKEVVAEDRKYWEAKRQELGDCIAAATPRRKDIKDRRVNPHTVLKNQKAGIEQKVVDYQIISAALDEETSVAMLERD